MKCSVLLFTVAIAAAATCFAIPFEGQLPVSNMSSDTWTVQSVPGGAMHCYPSVQVDSDGMIHMATMLDQGTTQQVWYWTWDGVNWTSEPVSAGDTWWPALALDSGDDPLIILYDKDTKLVKLFERQSPGQWSSTEVYSVGSGNFAEFLSIELDSQDDPFAAFYVHNEDILVFAHHDGTEWVIKDDFGNLEYPDLALNEDGDPRISYVTGSNIRCAIYQDEQWWHSGVANGYGWTAIDVDAAGETCIAYFPLASDYGMNLASNGGPGWELSVVDTTRYLTHADVLATPSGDLFIAYQDAINLDLRYAVNAGSGWEWAVLDYQDYSGFCPSAASDGAGHYCVAFCDSEGFPSPVNPNLKLAVFGTLCSIESEGHTVTPVIQLLQNPVISSAAVSFSLQEPGSVSLSVFTLDGRQVWHEDAVCPAGENVISTGELPPGVFMVRLETEGSAVSGKVTVVR